MVAPQKDMFKFKPRCTWDLTLFGNNLQVRLKMSR